MQEWTCIFAQQYSMTVWEQLEILLLQGVAMYDSAIAAWNVRQTPSAWHWVVYA